MSKSKNTHKRAFHAIVGLVVGTVVFFGGVAEVAWGVDAATSPAQPPTAADVANAKDSGSGSRVAIQALEEKKTNLIAARDAELKKISDECLVLASECIKKPTASEQKTCQTTTRADCVNKQTATTLDFGKKIDEIDVAITAARNGKAVSLDTLVKANTADVDQKQGKVNQLEDALKKCTDDACKTKTQDELDKAKADLTAAQQQQADLANQWAQVLAAQKSDLEAQLAAQDAESKGKFALEQKKIDDNYVAGIKECDAKLKKSEGDVFRSVAEGFCMGAEMCKAKAKTDNQNCKNAADKKRLDALSAAKAKLDSENKAKSETINETISTTNQKIQQATATKVSLGQCPPQRFEVELSAPLVRPPAITKGIQDNDRVKFNDHCFVWHGTDKYGQWYQIVSSETDSNELVLNYVREFYTYLAGTIGVLSVLMVIVGGIQISAAGLDQSAMESGKNRIIAALAGMTLLFLSSLLLYTINPNFFQF